jgi:hypothetical protein
MQGSIRKMFMARNRNIQLRTFFFKSASASLFGPKNDSLPFSFWSAFMALHWCRMLGFQGFSVLANVRTFVANHFGSA